MEVADPIRNRGFARTGSRARKGVFVTLTRAAPLRLPALPPISWMAF